MKYDIVIAFAFFDSMVQARVQGDSIEQLEQSIKSVAVPHGCVQDYNCFYLTELETEDVLKVEETIDKVLAEAGI